MRKSIISESAIKRHNNSSHSQLFHHRHFRLFPAQLLPFIRATMVRKNMSFVQFFAHGILKLKLLWKKLLNNVIKRAWTESFKHLRNNGWTGKSFLKLVLEAYAGIKMLWSAANNFGESQLAILLARFISHRMNEWFKTKPFGGNE